jgi:hypothetical protein
MTDRRRPYIDLTGRRFGRLVVTAYAGDGKWAWSCVCDCGACVLVRGDFLRRGITRSCGCITRERAKELGRQSRIDLTGKRFGRLIVVAYAEHRNWICNCICGARTIVAGSNLRRGQSKSCGCLARELSKSRATTHGMSKSREYRTWRAMRDRCLNPNSHAYEWYGGRGISICDDWLSFVALLADMGSRPPGCSIDRINNDGNYEPGNCQWAPPSVQARNRRPPKRKRRADVAEIRAYAASLARAAAP